MAPDVKPLPPSRPPRRATIPSRTHRTTPHLASQRLALPLTPERGTTPRCPIVGIGASAGGLAALQAFFTAMPATSGMAFVVISHQQQDGVSLLPTLLARGTTMPIHEVTLPIPVTPEQIYLAAPGTQLALLNGTLQPMEHDATHGPAFPIDHFLRTLAEEQREHAIAILLSGTGTDGTLGLQAIKSQRGMTLVQDEQEARFPGMPHSAHAAGLTDHTLPVAQMPSILLACVRGAHELGTERTRAPSPLTADVLRQIYGLLWNRTKHDFSSYKPLTMRRRIERRMRLHRLDHAPQYLQFLSESLQEIDLLFRDCLIGVTQFFRDPDAFARLAAPAVQLLQRAYAACRAVRVWVPGCATGEEAYSLAILLQEGREHLGLYVPVQIFATDLDSQHIEVARAGVYPQNIADDVSPARLKRYFVAADGGYRIRKNVRDMVVFAAHNLLADPPFTKLDLLSCRNVLIYLQPAMQHRLVSMFHHALLPDGLLFLGSSESIDDGTDLFTPVDTQWKIFQRQASSAMVRSPVAFPPFMRQVKAQDTPPQRLAKPPGTSLGTLVEQLLMQCFTPPSVLVNARGDVIHIHGRTGQFLQPAQGLQSQQNLLSMAREGLQLELATALYQATSSRERVRQRARVKTNDGLIAVEITVQALADPEPLCGLFLVTFQILPPPAVMRGTSVPPLSQTPLAVLESKLQQMRKTLQGKTEAAETLNEKLQVTNEELQAANEDLRSANEELESAKEEMQALNEELQIVNSELKEKVESLTQAHDDMQNLLNSTGIATLFLDAQLRIKWFTPQVTWMIKIRSSDVGRPLADLASTLAYDRLEADAQEVLQTLVSKDMTIPTHNGERHHTRIIPYRTSDNAIDGVVITFINLSMCQVKAHEQGQ